MHPIRNDKNNHIITKQSYKNLYTNHKRWYNTYKETNKSRKQQII